MMTNSTAAVPPEPRKPPAGSKFQPVGKLKHLVLEQPVTLVAAGFVILCIAIAFVGPSISPYDATMPDFEASLQPPSAEHWLGTDQTGFDIFSQILSAMRVDLGIAFAGTGIALAIGAPCGTIAGYFHGKKSILSFFGETMMRVGDIVQSFPVFILALSLVAMRGPSIANVVMAVAFVNAPQYLRLFYAETLSLRERAFIDAAVVAGSGNARIILHHIIPNSFGTGAVQISVSVGFAVLLTAGLSFLGAGVQPPTPELGAMVANGASNIVTGAWWPSLFPGMVIGMMVFSFARVGDVLAVVFDPRRHK